MEAHLIFDFVPTADAVVKAVHAYAHSLDYNTTSTEYEVLDLLRPGDNASGTRESVDSNNEEYVVVVEANGTDADCESNIFCHDGSSESVANGTITDSSVPSQTNDTTSVATPFRQGQGLSLTIIVIVARNASGHIGRKSWERARNDRDA